MAANYPQRASSVRDNASLEEMRSIVHLAAEPFGLHDNAKTLIARAAGVLSVSLRRAKALWYGEADHWLGAAEIVRLRAERERLYQERLERLRVEIAETERLLLEAKRRADAQLAQAKMERLGAADRPLAEPLGQMVRRHPA